jgi:hypothetical protein
LQKKFELNKAEDEHDMHGEDNDDEELKNDITICVVGVYEFFSDAYHKSA